MVNAAELEHLYNALKMNQQEADARLMAHETQMSELRNFAESSAEKLTSQLNLSLQAKTEFADLEALAHRLNSKVDFERVQELIGDLKSEIVSQLSTVKKDVKKKTT